MLLWQASSQDIITTSSSATARKTTSLRQATAFGRRSRPSADEDGWQSKGDRWVSEFVEALNAEHKVDIINTTSWKVESSIPVGRNPHIPFPSPDGKLMYVTSKGDNKIVIVNIASQKVIGEIPVFGWPRIISMSPDGQTMYLTLRWLNGAVKINTTTKKIFDWIPLPDTNKFPSDGKASHGIGLSFDGKNLYISSQVLNSVSIVDVATNSIIGEIPVGKDPNWVDFTKDGKYAIVRNTASGDVSVIPIETKKVIATIKVGKSPKRLAVGNNVLN